MESLENQAELARVLRIVVQLEEERTPAEAKLIAESAGLEVDLVKELMAQARANDLAIYFAEVEGRQGSPIRSWGGWTVTLAGHEFLDVAGDPT